jgi:hypothetical protein
MGTSLGTLNMKNTGSTFTPGGTRSRQSHQRVAGGNSPTRPAVGQRPATSEVPIEQPLIWTTSLPRSAYRSTRARRSPVVFVSATGRLFVADRCSTVKALIAESPACPIGPTPLPLGGQPRSSDYACASARTVEARVWRPEHRAGMVSQ